MLSEGNCCLKRLITIAFINKEGLKMKLVKRLTNPKEIPNFAAETKQVKRE